MTRPHLTRRALVALLLASTACQWRPREEPPGGGPPLQVPDSLATQVSRAVEVGSASYRPPRLEAFVHGDSAIFIVPVQFARDDWQWGANGPPTSPAVRVELIFGRTIFEHGLSIGWVVPPSDSLHTGTLAQLVAAGSGRVRRGGEPCVEEEICRLGRPLPSLSARVTLDALRLVLRDTMLIREARMVGRDSVKIEESGHNRIGHHERRRVPVRTEVPPGDA